MQSAPPSAGRNFHYDDDDRGYDGSSLIGASRLVCSSAALLKLLFLMIFMMMMMLMLMVVLVLMMMKMMAMVNHLDADDGNESKFTLMGMMAILQW